MDLRQFDLKASAEKGVGVHLRSPIDDQPLHHADGRPVTITVCGADGPTYQEAQARARQALIMTGLGGEEIFRATPQYREALEEQTCHVLAAATRGWDGVQVDGSPWTFTREAAFALYQRFPWVRTQIDAAVNDRKLFHRPAG